MAKKKTKTAKVQQLRVLLIKAGYKKDEVILKHADKLGTYPLSGDLPFKGTLFVKPQYANPPSWLGYVKANVQGDMGNLKNASTAAVLLIHAKKRVFVLTFGYGRNLLIPECWSVTLV